MTATKSARLNVRLSAEDDALLRQAASAMGQPVSQFLTASAVDHAHELLDPLQGGTWAKFNQQLAAPITWSPALAALVSTPRP